MYYNFYNLFKENEKILQIPFVKLEVKDTFKTYIWNKSYDRLDIVSNKFYSNPYGGKLILTYNPMFGGSEDNIPDGAKIVIPFPYNTALQNYIDAVNFFKNLY